jgi:hypothetical protein
MLPRVMDVSATDLNRQTQHPSPTDDERPGFRDDRFDSPGTCFGVQAQQCVQSTAAHDSAVQR